MHKQLLTTPQSMPMLPPQAVGESKMNLTLFKTSSLRCYMVWNYPFGQFKSAVTVLFPPSSLSPSLWMTLVYKTLLSSNCKYQGAISILFLLEAKQHHTRDFDGNSSIPAERQIFTFFFCMLNIDWNTALLPWKEKMDLFWSFSYPSNHIHTFYPLLPFSSRGVSSRRYKIWETVF